MICYPRISDLQLYPHLVDINHCKHFYVCVALILPCSTHRWVTLLTSTSFVPIHPSIHPSNIIPPSHHLPPISPFGRTSLCLSVFQTVFLSDCSLLCLSLHPLSSAHLKGVCGSDSLGRNPLTVSVVVSE